MLGGSELFLRQSSESQKIKRKYLLETIMLTREFYAPQEISTSLAQSRAVSAFCGNTIMPNCGYVLSPCGSQRSSCHFQKLAECFFVPELVSCGHPPPPPRHATCLALENISELCGGRLALSFHNQDRQSFTHGPVATSSAYNWFGGPSCLWQVEVRPWQRDFVDRDVCKGSQMHKHSKTCSVHAASSSDEQHDCPGLHQCL